MVPMNLNSEFAKLGILAVLSPLWWPFLRELWKEMNDALSEEGGILGRPRSVEDEKRQQDYRSPLVSTPFRDPVHRMRAEASSQRSSQPGTPGSPATRTRRTGFERQRR
jgi:hypothetical protein